MSGISIADCECEFDAQESDSTPQPYQAMSPPKSPRQPRLSRSSAAMSSSAPPTMAPARETPSAISCSRFIAAGGAARLLDRRPEAQRLAHGVVPLAGALDAAALRPAGEDGRLDELLVLLGL